MVDEAPDAGFSEASQALHKVEPLTDCVVWIVVDALLGCRLAEHVGQKGGVAGFLVGHELDERHVFRIETSLEEFGLGEAGETVVEEVELNPFLLLGISRTPDHERLKSNLVQAQRDGLVIEVTLHHVAWERAIRAQATRWSVWSWKRVDGLAASVVVGRRRVQWQGCDGSGKSGRSILGPGGCRGAGVRTMVSGAGVTITELLREWVIRASRALRLV